MYQIPYRHLDDIPKLENARDQGGLPLIGGGETRRRAFVRSDNLSQLTSEGHQALLIYGVRTVIDLRYSFEHSVEPSYYDQNPAGDMAYRPISLCGEQNDPVYQPLLDTKDAVDWCLMQFNQGQPMIASVLRAIVAAPEGGVLFHCHAGKDRTGMIGQLLLGLAGVSEPDIMADYLLSNERLERRGLAWLATITDPAERAKKSLFWMVQQEAMEATLAAVRARGGVRAYMTQIGMTEQEIAALRARLV